MNNFIYKLADYIKKLDLGYPVQIGKFSGDESLVIIPIEGSTIIGEYMDGAKEIRMSFSIAIKSKSQESAFNTLSEVIAKLTSVNSCLGKENQQCTLLNVVAEQMPYFAKEQEIGYFIYNSKIVVDVIGVK